MYNIATKGTFVLWCLTPKSLTKQRYLTSGNEMGLDWNLFSSILSLSWSVLCLSLYWPIRTSLSNRMLTALNLTASKRGVTYHKDFHKVPHRTFKKQHLNEVKKYVRRNEKQDGILCYWTLILHLCWTSSVLSASHWWAQASEFKIHQILSQVRSYLLIKKQLFLQSYQATTL